ncbi:MAG: sigma-70 family RNA polymerase sigma factor [Planctomycetia bacterium]|nr:sigma-70 family RNA polymerase sigma factor [Planctomycetia bacterium]
MANSSSRPVRFATTRWSLVAAAGKSDQSKKQDALSELCARYWPPLYAYLRQDGYDRHDARDMTQAFILDLLHRNPWAVADPQRGRFRTFLLSCMKNFLSHEREKKQAHKRGGSKLTFSMYQVEGEQAYQAVAREASPEVLFEKVWLNIILKRVMKRFLEPDQKTEDSKLIEQLLPSILGTKPDYDALATQHQKTPAALRQMVSKLRKKYQQLLLEEIGDTVTEPVQIEEEIQYLFNLASRKS